jgi:large subunit ribosomal protein L15
MKLNDLRDNPGAKRPRKRVGRGIGSGTGKTATRGQKGQGSRAGVAIRTFEGGQLPLHRRLPRRGFKNPTRRTFAEVNLGRLQAAIDAGKLDPKATIDASALIAAGVLRRERDGLRVLADGELKQALTIKAAGASAAARARVEQAGGSLILPAPKAAEAEAEPKKKAKAKVKPKRDED